MPPKIQRFDTFPIWYIKKQYSNVLSTFNSGLAAGQRDWYEQLPQPFDMGNEKIYQAEILPENEFLNTPKIWTGVRQPAYSIFLIATKKLNKKLFSLEEHIFFLKKEIFKSLDIAFCSVFKRETITAAY